MARSGGVSGCSRAEKTSACVEVGKVQGNAVAFLKPDGKLSWLWWPKAKDVQVEENAFTVLQNGVPKLKYIYAG